MKKLLLLCSSILVLGSVAQAAPCVSGSLDSYVALGAGGCEFEGLTFSNFQLLTVPFGATELPSINITVNPLMAGPMGGTGLEFALTVAAGAGSYLASSFQYDVSPFVIPVLTSVELTGAMAMGDGVVTALTIANGTALIALVDGFSSLPFSSSVIPAAMPFTVLTEIGVDGGPGGSASFTAASNRFSQVPEPSAWLLTATGLLAAGAISRRKA
ncbi:MAG: PEP-CTERM sorting domain-containing protein [Bryobacteraceae bacterium]|nr:PEP-CTERM sorting domain-containing protein [Bryobacteraceae bacterium]